MSSISYNNRIPSDGNPEGIVDAPKGALFHKTGSFYKVNHSGSVATGWVNVYFNPPQQARYFLTAADISLLSVDSGSWLYTKTTAQGTAYGWTLLSKETPFNPIKLS